MPLGTDDILNDVIRTRSAHIVKSPEGDPRVNPDFISETKTREFVMAPISGKDNVLRKTWRADKVIAKARESVISGLPICAWTCSNGIST